MNNKITILVNSSDNFEDCWNPFFILFKKNWANCTYPIFLNTEFKEYSIDGLNILSTKSHKNTNDRKLTWSECLINAVKQIDSPLILYFQEDYFLDMPVKVDFIEKVAAIMLENPEIKRVGLVTTDSIGKLYQSDYRELWEISNNARYRISTQTSLWRQETLLSYLRPEENGWMFEIFGTWRSKKRKEKFLTLNRDLFSGDAKKVSYLHTGIIKGKWHPEIPKLFLENNIKVDFSIRGFYDLNISTIKRKTETFRKLLLSPKILFKALYESI